MCGSEWQACPKVPNSTRDQTECYDPKAGVFGCLNRMDKFSDTFTQSLYKGEPFNLNKLPFNFTETHIRCQENNWIPWTEDGLSELRWTKSCQSNSGKTVGGMVLHDLLIRDMGFKGRHLIPEWHLIS